MSVTPSPTQTIASGGDATWTFNFQSGTNNGIPFVVTLTPVSVNNTSVTLQGSATTNNAPTNAWFEYGPTPSLGGLVGSQYIGSSGSSISYSYLFSGLSQNTTYYYRAVAQNSFGTSYGNILSFTTASPSGQVPVVTTGSATPFNQGSAILYGNVTPNNASTNAWFEYGPTSVLGNVTVSQSMGSGNSSISYSSTLSSLQPNTTYYYRAVAQNAGGISYGSVLTFLTQQGSYYGGVPTVFTNTAFAIGQTFATLSASVNPNSTVTNMWFEFGTTQSLGSSVGFQSAGSGTSLTTFSYALSGLQPVTTYYYRVVAQNSGGTSYGNIISFTTSYSGINGTAGLPIVTTRSFSSVSDARAILNAIANPNGTDTFGWFEWGRTTAFGHTTFSKPLGSGNDPVVFSLAASGLSAHTLYYYRAVAQNAKGPSYGETMSFYTRDASLPVPPQAPPPPPAPVPTPWNVPAPSPSPTPVPSSSPAFSSSLVSVVPRADKNNPQQGETVNITLIYKNEGADMIQNALLRLNFPQEFTYQNANISPSAQSSSNVDFILGTVAGRSQGALTVQLKTGDTVPADSVLVINAILNFQDSTSRGQSVSSFLALTTKEKTGRKAVASASASDTFQKNSSLIIILLILILIGMCMYLFFVRPPMQRRREIIHESSVPRTPPPF